MSSIRWQKLHEAKIERPPCGSRRFHREQLHVSSANTLPSGRIEARTALRRLLFWVLVRYRPLEKCDLVLLIASQAISAALTKEQYGRYVILKFGLVRMFGLEPSLVIVRSKWQHH